MNTLTLLLATAIISTGQDTVTYTNPDLNLTFSYPKTWTLTTKASEANARIPLEGSDDPAILEIRSVPYFSEPEGWQEVQASLAKSSRRELVKQWQEELLGVPILLTKTQYAERGVDKTRQTGLLYSATRKKLVYHLTAPTKHFDQAETAFKTALQSLRTIDGSTPQPEVPGREKGPYDPGVDTRPPLIIKPPEAAKRQYVKGPVTVACSAAGQNLLLRLPAGWTAEKGEGDKVTVKHSQLSAPLTVTIQSTLDGDLPERAILKVGSAELANFTKVDKREDARNRENKAGARIFSALRSGTTANGMLITTDAAGLTGDYYWMMSARWTSPEAYRSDMRLLAVLMQEMSVEPAQ
jgi:hypothetical protein